MKVATRNRLIIGTVAVLAGAFLAYEMFFSLTPPRHADHDHAMASLDSGGFLWIEGMDGKRHNLVGRPNKVLVLHWFDAAAADPPEEVAAAGYARSVAGDPAVGVLLVGQAPSPAELASWAQTAGVPAGLLFVDQDGRTGELIGVRRLPETLVYDPAGLLAFQTRGPAGWADPQFHTRIEAAKAGVSELH